MIWQVYVIITIIVIGRIHITELYHILKVTQNIYTEKVKVLEEPNHCTRWRFTVWDSTLK
jgi:hypothetical protein